MLIASIPTRRTKTGMLPSLVNPAWSAGSPDVEGWFAEVGPDADGLVLHVSRLDGEDGWTVDSMFRRGMPIFVNGFGARYLRTHRVTADVAAVLDAAVPS